ncbi:hypothetical protein B9Z55_014379 [Caenorhabditis nigoni]|uniref:Uncharacterized protein n=1 Tax=Caenorhabditis nigoni TaxID=1611254 RepID=A0A2G5U5M6_9PELO|nr:hypothetical protein B9Z55_014379 [Caenorhabditis nigoni]
MLMVEENIGGDRYLSPQGQLLESLTAKHIVRCALPSSKNGDSMPDILAVMWTVALRNVTDQFNIASTGKFMESVNDLGAKDIVPRTYVSSSLSSNATDVFRILNCFFQ